MQTALAVGLLPLIALREEYDLETVFTGEGLATVGVVVGVATLLQALYVLPIRAPRSNAHSVSAWARMSIAACMIGAAIAATGLGVLGLREILGLGTSHFGEALHWAAAGVTFLTWITATPLLVAFARRHPQDDTLGRVAALVFKGTSVELLALFPIDVLMRRRSTCYCHENSFWAIVGALGVGLWALGPGLLYVTFQRRRRRWPLGRCESCGHAMTDRIAPARCPACGLGWRDAVQNEERAPASA